MVAFLIWQSGYCFGVGQLPLRSSWAKDNGGTHLAYDLIGRQARATLGIGLILISTTLPTARAALISVSS